MAVIVFRVSGIPVQYVGPFPSIREAIEYGRKSASDVDWGWVLLDAPEG